MPANVADKILITDPKSLEERRKVAEEFASQFKVTLPILVDTIDDQIEKAYYAWPDRFYVIDVEGKIAYKGGVGPGGFKVAEVPPVLDRLLGIPSDAKAPAAQQPLPAGAAPSMRERLLTMLDRLGVEEKDRAPIHQAVDRKMEAYQAVLHARRWLMAAAQGGNDVTKALTDFQEAQKSYRQAAEKADRELDAAIGYSKKPSLLAGLTAMGVIGDAAAPPFAGLPGPMGPAGRRAPGPDDL